MEIDIDELIMKKDSLVNKQKEIEMTRGNLKKKYSQLYQQVTKGYYKMKLINQSTQWGRLKK